jgi:hypothetical protein
MRTLSQAEVHPYPRTLVPSNRPSADEVCRCGHGRSVHRSYGASECSACREAIDEGESPPSGHRCVAFGGA